MKKKLFKILAVASMLITSFPAVPVFASNPTPKTVQVGPEETYTSLKELFDGMVDEGPLALTVQLTGDTTIDGNLEVPRNKGIDYLHLTGNGHSVNVTAASGSALFANGAELTIGDRVTFNKNITIYGGGNNAAVAGDTNISVYQSVINGAIYAGSLKGSVGGTTSINISDSDVRTVVFGSNGAANELSRSSISSSTIENMYLGNINANTPGMPEHLISGTTVTNAYLAKNGTVSGNVNFYVSPASSTINNFAKGEGVTATGKQTIYAGIGEEDGMTLTVKNVSLGNADSGKFAINVSQKNTFKLGGSKASHLDSLTLENGAKLYLNDSYTISNLTTNNGVIYLPESGTLTVNGELEGNAKVNFSKTYQEGDVVVATPANDSSDKVYSNVTGVSLIKSANATNTTWVYSQDAIVTVNAGEGGTVSKNSLYVTKGTDCNISFTPNEGYVVDTVKVDGVENADIVSGQTVTLSNVQADTVVDIAFKEIDLTVVKEMVDALPTQYSGEADRNVILNTKILYEDFGGDYSFGATYAQKMKDALLLLPQIEFASSSKHATVTNPESILHTFTKSDAEAILNGTYSKIVFGLYEAQVSEVGYQTILGAALGGDMSRNFHLKFGKRYVGANGNTKKFKDVDLTKQNTVNVSITPTSAETTPASGYNERRVRVYYTEDTWTEENPVEYFVYFMEDTTPNTKEYTIQPNKLGAYVVTYWDVNSPSKDHILVVFRTTVGKWSDETGFLPKLMFLEKDANGNATLSKDMIPTTMTAPLGGVYSETEGYWTPSINTSVGAIKGDTEFVWTFEINLADYSRINELIEKASVYTAENAYNYNDLKASIDAVKWGLNILKQKEVDAMADKIQVELNATRFKEADYTAVDQAISNGQTPIISGWVIDTTEYDKAVAAVDRTKNITQQAEVDAMAKAINDAVARFEYKPGDYGRVNNAVARANTYDETLYENWKDVETALNAIVYGLKINEQDRINDMAWEVEKALDALNPKKADYSEVQKIVDAFDYTLYKNPAVFQEVAFAINWDYRITEQHLVDAYVEQLNNAKAQLVLRDADYSAVNQAISDFNYLYADNEFCEPETVQAVRDAIDAVVYGKTILEQAEVDAMAKAIRDAMSNVKYQQANYSEVERQIAIANSLNKDLYTNWSFVEMAISDVIWGKDASEQALVDQMAYNIEWAISSLEYKPADYTEIYKALERIENYESTDFEDFSEVQMWIDAINWNYRLDMQHEVDYLAEELNNAIDNLKLLPADYSEVQELINRAEMYNGDLYANWADVEAAINAVDWTKGRSEQMAVNEMARKIYDALENLQLKGADYTELQKAVDKFNELDPGLYGDAYYDLKYIVDTIDWNLQANEQDYVDKQTQIILDAIEALTPVLANYAEVNAAIERAYAINQEEVIDFSKVEEAINSIVWDLPYEEQTTVDTMAKAINDAINALEYKPADYTAVDKAIEDANTLDSALFQNFGNVTSAIDAVVRGYDIRKQAEVDAMAKAITDALDTLEYKPADYTELNKTIAEANSLNKDLFKNFSAVQTVLDKIETGLDIRHQTTIDSWNQELTTAIQNLQYKPADYTAVDEAIAKANQINPSLYLDFSKVTEAINAVVRGKNITQQAEVDSMAKAITDAINALEYKPADYTAVDEAMEKANAVNKDLYSNFDKVTEAINAVVRGKNITEQEEVDAMAVAIERAIVLLTYKDADYTAVDNAIARANSLNRDLYKDFSGVINAIEAVQRGKDITEQASVNAMAKAINDAIDALEYKDADYTAVDNAIAKAEALNKDLYKNYSVVTNAINAVVRGKDITEQASVDAMAKAINDAIDALEYKDADYTAVDKAIDDANKLNKDLYKDFTEVTNAINSVVRGKNITEQAEVDAMAKAITDAIDALEYKDADYSRVDTLIAIVEGLNRSEFEDLSAVDAAVSAVVRGKNITEQAEVDAMAEAIQKALDEACDFADYTEVEKAIETFENLEHNLYTSETLKDVQDAIDAVIWNKASKNQALVDAMAKAINDAIDALEYKDADYTAVDKAIEKSQEFDQNLYINFDEVTDAINAVVRGKDIREQATVDAMAKAINDAIDALEYKDADYTGVREAIARAEALDKNLYKDFSGVTNAINSVNWLKDIRSQDKVDAMAKAINDAIDALEYRDADYSAVEKAIEEANKLNKDLYKNFEIVTNAINAVDYTKDITEQNEVDVMAKAITDAINALVYKDADYTAVDKAIADAEKLNKDLYKNFEVVTDSINAVVRGKNITEQAAVDAMAKAITDAIDALEYKSADYTAVDKAIADTNQLNKDLYKNFEIVTNAINAVNRNKNITEQAAVDAMAKAINDAIDALEYKDADYTAVDKAITKANSLDKTWFKDFTKVTEAINAVVRGKDIREQATVDAMAKAINDAINALEYVDADYSKVDAAIAKANTFDKDLYKNFNNVTAAINAVVRGKNISEQAEVDAMADAINKAIDDLRYNDADYTAVDAAIKNAKTYNLNLYVNGNAVTKAINAVDRNKDFTQQAEVDAMAKAINDAVDALEYKAADYTAVDKAIAKANALDKKLYKDFTKVTAAINAVVRDKDITEQKAVDAMAKAINDAIAKLEYKSFSVKFDANGGANLSAETITKTYGSSLGELPTVTRNGFKFLGWFTKKDGGTQITTTTKMGSTNPTYYAHWEQKETGVIRIFGSDRYQTAFKVGITLKGVLDADKVDTIIIASGKGFADALAGNYLAAKKNAPIIMTDGKNAKDVQDYIVTNVKKGGTVYVLGGTAAVPSNVTKGLKGYTVKRLDGKDRYETNLAILKEAGVNGEDILISTGKNFADSLSASATGRPILLVDKKLTASQREFLSGLKDSDFYVLGGVNAVSKSIENSIKGYGTVVRLAGDSRYETSVMIAKTFFKTPSYAVVAYGKNYPDGLSGGALAYQMGGPLLLVENKAANTIADYTASAGITSGVVLGGSGLISDSTARKIFKLEVTAEIVVK